MALFKILKGSGNLPTTKTEGWAYVKKTGDDSADFYVDYDNNTRLKINCNADTLTNKPAMTIINGQSNGPVLTITAGGKTSDEKIIPEATDAQSGVVTTVDQIFAGNKFTKGSHIGLINGGETDQFLDFAHAGDPTATTAPGASWRIGSLNSGSGDSNYFVVQTGGSDTNATVWNNAIRIGMNTLDMTLGGNLLPKTTNTLTIGTSDLKWENIYATTFTGNLVGTADYASRWSSSRTITFAGGDVTGSFSISGAANVNNVVLTVADDSHNHIIGNVDGLQDTINNINTALDLKAPLASPNFVGTPKAPTAAEGTNTTQIATTAFVTNAVAKSFAANDAMLFKGTIGTGGTVTSLPATHNIGWTYRVITTGTYAGTKCEVGDLIICIADGTAANNSHWTVAQTNIDGAIIRDVTTGVGSSTQPIYVNSSGIVRPTTYALNATVPANAVFTDTKNTAGSTNSDSKLFLIGATSQATNPQTYSDSEVYTTNGTLTAKTFEGSGAKLTNLREAYLEWGGRNLAGSYGPIDAAMIPNLGANRLAYVPAAGITLEYSRDGGSTWTVIDNNNQKAMLFAHTSMSSANYANLYIGNDTATGIDKSKYMIRATLRTGNGYGNVYTTLNKFAIYISTNGSRDCYCTIDARTETNRSSKVDTWVTFADKVRISGLPGWNIININPLTTYGNSQDIQYGEVRFTFGVTSHASSVAHSGLEIRRIMGFGGAGWLAPSNAASEGTIYSTDYQQNVTFPAAIQTKSLKIPTTSGGTTYGVGSNGQVLKSNGSTIYWGTDNNTDTKVTQTVTTSNTTYPLLLAPSGQTATTTTTSYFNSGVTLNPSTNTIAANISGNAATATSATKAIQDGSGNIITDKYVTLDTPQTISEAKTFSKAITLSTENYIKTSDKDFIFAKNSDFNHSYLTPDDTSSGETFMKAALAAVCSKYPGHTNPIIMGNLIPNSSGPLYGSVYNTSIVHSTTKLPQYSTFQFTNLNGSMQIFGTYNYEYYNRTVLDSNNYTSYTVTKTGGGASGNWDININGTAKAIRVLSSDPISPIVGEIWVTA